MRSPSTRSDGTVRTGTFSRNNAAKIYGSHSAQSEHRYGDPRYPISIIDAPRKNRRGLHPTEKPLSLLRWVVSTYSHEGDWILDPCSGSGVTAEAALALGRNVVCVEQDPAYFEVGLRRAQEVVDRENLAAEVLTQRE